VSADPGLAAFPTDDLTLDMVEASLAYCLTIDKETSEPVPVDPGVVSLSDLLDFLSGTTTDPLGVVEHQGVVETFFGPAEMTVDPRPHYTERDVIKALIDEVRRLRAELAEYHRPDDECAHCYVLAGDVAAAEERAARAEGRDQP
jgi:hypothetical protein